MIPSWLSALVEKDPSLSLALAVLVRKADADGVMEFNTLVPGFRHVFQTSERSLGHEVVSEVSTGS